MTNANPTVANATMRASAPNASRQLELKGVRVHNLKQVDLDIPLGKLVVLSGVSGSGKSSLAFDTIFAEGQRRYIESFSASARQYLERIERPNADRIAHVPPTIAIRTDSFRRQATSRSTVASLAEIDAGLKRLFSRVGRVFCTACNTEVRPSSPEDVARSIGQLPEGTRVQLCFLPQETDQPHEPGTWRMRGYARAIVGGRSVSLDELAPDIDLATVLLVADRLVIGQPTIDRITESVETAFREGDGDCLLLIANDTSPNSSIDSNSKVQTIDERSWQALRFSQRWECTSCRRPYLPPELRLFDADFAQGCPECRADRQITGDDCPGCQGTRLCPQALAVRIQKHNLADLLSLTAAQAPLVIEEILQGLDDTERAQARISLEDLDRRLSLVAEIGLGHLSLKRNASTLSEGQVRRLMLAAAVGSRITGTLCLVDEPSAGLHASEIAGVIRILRRLLEHRNSVIVVDHALEIVREADHVIDLGPGAGPSGGTVLFAGSPKSLVHVPESPTGRALSGEFSRPAARKKRQPQAWLTLANIRHRHLQYVSVRFPVGVLCVVTGPGGSGKTSLIVETLVPAMLERLGEPRDPVTRQRYESLTGGESLTAVAVVDRLPLTRSSRSNAATWLEVFDDIREVFALTPDAKQRGFGPPHFSFNAAAGGRCRACRGMGILRHDMQFLPDVSLPCPECGGTRYRRDVLDIKYRGRSIADVLAMSAAEAAAFFRNHPRLQARLQMLKQIGLDYLVLGQPTDTLSGGEAQRLKLVSRLTSARGPTLIVCDEATIGLHPADIPRLVACFNELISVGHSVIAIDNTSELIGAADEVMELPR